MANAKVETPEHFHIRKEKEAKEIIKWEKEKAKPKPKWYFFYFLFIVTVVYIVDEITSQISTQMQDVISSVLAEMLGGSAAATSTLTTISTITMIAGFASYLYKPLSDKYGRKIFLFINTLGMGLGMFIVGLTTNVPVYLLGALCITFFTPHDMQVIYIQETCPKERRGTYYTVIKSIATLSIFLIPLLRSIFIKDSYDEWRFVFFIPAIIALVISALAILLMRETDPFIDNRLKFLKMSDEEREEARKRKEASTQKNGMIAGFKYIFTHKAIMWLAIADIFVWMGMGITQNYNVVMKYGFAGIQTMEQVAAYGDTLQTVLDAQGSKIVEALYLFSVGSAIAQFIPGFIADKWGRRNAAIFSSVLSVTAFAAFSIGVNNGMNTYLIGLLAGISVGAYWLVGDMVYFICSESVPTSVRVSVINAFGIFMYPGLAIGVLLPSILGMIIGSDVYLAVSTIITSIIGLTMTSILLIAKVKETKNVDISAITGNE